MLTAVQEEFFNLNEWNIDSFVIEQRLFNRYFGAII